MQIRRRRQLATLWRSTWVPKGTDGNTHGYKREHYVGSLPLDALVIPAQLAARLTPDERVLVQQRVIGPALQHEEQLLQAQVEREADPVWRLAEATRLMDEAAERARRRPLDGSAVAGVQAALSRLQPSAVHPAPMAPDGVSQLRAIRDAMREAASAIRNGALGRPPSNDVRSTSAYKAWSDIYAEVAPGRSGNLLDALQQSGFVKRRGR